jgi:predicted phosphodiesterase
VASGPGRACPASYGYGARAFDRRPELEVETLWVAGGLYGNPYALERLVELYHREPGSKALVFNGDFHWFDVRESQFRRIDEGVRPFLATRGNVETELASPAGDAGCGCGYPDFVDDGTVARSNAILEKLRATAMQLPQARAALAALPMHLVAAVGGVRVAVVHGDADSLAGWGFSQEVLATTQGLEAARRAFGQAGVDVFASSHSCLPVLQEVRGGGLIANNGAAGMPNFRGTRYGLATRISVSPFNKSLYSQKTKHLHVEAVALDYDHAAWERCFLGQWPAGSEAHRSYYERIVHGPRYRLDQALRCAALAA